MNRREFMQTCCLAGMMVSKFPQPLEARSKTTSFSLHYARLFQVSSDFRGVVLQMTLPGEDEPYSWHLVSKEQFSSSVRQDSTLAKIGVPVSTAACLSSEVIDAVATLNCLQSIVAVYNSQYVFHPQVLQQRFLVTIHEESAGNYFDYELLFGLQSEVIFNSFSTMRDHKLYASLNLPVVYHLGTLEAHPLAAAEWIKMVALFYGKFQEASWLFEGIINDYRQVQEEIQDRLSGLELQRPVVFTGNTFAVKEEGFIHHSNT